MNNFSLVSVVMSFLFCGYLNSAEQPVADASAQKAETTNDEADNSQNTVVTKEAISDDEKDTKVKKQKISKKKKCKRKSCCKKGHQKGDDITEKLNKGESLTSSEKTVKPEATNAKASADETPKTEVKDDKKAESK